MENKTVYLDQRFNPHLSGHFFLLYWLIPALCIIGIPVTAYALTFQIPSEISAYGHSTKLWVVIGLGCLALILALHALVAFVVQAIRDFPVLIASIDMKKDGTLAITPFVGKREFTPPVV